jgi:hypothetical protein
MLFALVVGLQLQASPSATQPVAPADPWSRIRFMVGEWQGESEGQPGKGTVKRTYAFVLHDRFLYEENVSTYPPQPKNEKGEVHEHRSCHRLADAYETTHRLGGREAPYTYIHGTPALSRNPATEETRMNADMSELRKTARLAGLQYLVMSLAGGFSMLYVPSLLMVPGDTAATVKNILSSERLFRFGLVAGLISQIFLLLLVLTLYRLLRAVHPQRAALMVALVVTAVAIACVNLVNPLAALHLLVVLIT